MKIQNKDIIHVINFLGGLDVKGMKSIHRSRIVNKLMDKMELFTDAQTQLKEEYKEDVKGFQVEFKKLVQGYSTIDDTDSKVEVTAIKSIVKPLVADDSEFEFKDGDAIAIAVLYEALELDK